MAVHNPGSKPDFYNGVSVGPGTETTIRITSTNRTRLPLPYDNADCTKQKYLPYSDNETYSYDACYGVCMQNTVVENCRCIEGSYPYTRKQLLSVNSIICGNQSLLEKSKYNNTDWIGQVICSVAIFIMTTPAMYVKQCAYFRVRRCTTVPAFTRHHGHMLPNNWLSTMNSSETIRQSMAKSSARSMNQFIRT